MEKYLEIHSPVFHCNSTIHIGSPWECSLLKHNVLISWDQLYRPRRWNLITHLLWTTCNNSKITSHI